MSHEQDEFVQLLTEHQASIRAYIYSLMPGSPGIGDVLQETNITLWRKRGKFQPGTNFTAWSFAVARFAVLEFRRKNSRYSHFTFNEELMDTLAFSARELEPEPAENRHAALESCLGRLSKTHRDLIQLRYDSDISIEQFARSHGKSAGSIRVTLHQIRTALRRCINFKLRQAETVR